MAPSLRPNFRSASFKACRGSWLVGVPATGVVVAPAGDPLVFVGAEDGVVEARVGGTLGTDAGPGVTVAPGAGAALALLLDAAGWLACEVPNCAKKKMAVAEKNSM